ncbi:putative Phosphatidylcholine-sterol acyltransferase [Paratrimastix pyriformis]|uniref:Phosphatidylcholine-sterol acyltransferase n=1 Tax=Paratrimastix pyriformis TaxID=342808 RepID=A0ABQ8UGV9_9EUKA|nr:putative Phosphatidylcholine-sterol acyltransferase [Paratrimastix pyriformis]
MTNKGVYRVVLLVLLVMCGVSSASPNRQQGTRSAEWPAEDVLFSLPSPPKDATQSALFGARTPVVPIELVHNYLASRKVSLDQIAQDRHPIIFVPGLGGSVLEAQLTGFDYHWSCPKHTDHYEPLWLNIPNLLFTRNCFFEELTLNYDPAANRYSPRQGVHIRPRDFGGLDGINYLSRVLGFPIDFTSYFSHLIDALVKLGYRPGVELRGMPYDFRMPADMVDAERSWETFARLIEDTYRQNGDRPAYLVTHSMGGLKMAYLLAQMPQEWKDRYVAGLVTLSAPWLGATKGLRVVVSGDNLGAHMGDIEVLPHLDIRQTMRKSGGAVWMVPEAEAYADEILVQTNNRTYTGAQLADLFASLDPDTAAIYGHTRNQSIHVLGPPRVPTHCIYGTAVPTEGRLRYGDSFDQNPGLLYTTGDGTVPLKSLSYCQQWASTQTQPVTVKRWPGRSHLSILFDEQVIHEVLDVVTAPPLRPISNKLPYSSINLFLACFPNSPIFGLAR